MRDDGSTLERISLGQMYYDGYQSRIDVSEAFDIRYTLLLKEIRTNLKIKARKVPTSEAKVLMVEI